MSSQQYIVESNADKMDTVQYRTIVYMDDMMGVMFIVNKLCNKVN